MTVLSHCVLDKNVVHFQFKSVVGFKGPFGSYFIRSASTNLCRQCQRTKKTRSYSLETSKKAIIGPGRIKATLFSKHPRHTSVKHNICKLSSYLEKKNLNATEQ